MVPTRGVQYTFCEGERVLCYDPDPARAKVLYDSKVLEVIESNDERGRRTVHYLIHFWGWNSSWDRCVSENFVLKDTEENRQLQRDLAETQLQQGAYLYRRRERKKVSDSTAAGSGAGKRAQHGFNDAGSGAGERAQHGFSDDGSGAGKRAQHGFNDDGSGAGKRTQHGFSNDGSGAGKRAQHGFSDDGSGAGKRAQHGFSDDGSGAGKRAQHGFSDDGSGAGKRAQHGFSDDGSGAGKRAQHGFSDDGSGAGKRAQHGFSDDGNGAGKRAQHGFSDDGRGAGKRAQHGFSDDGSGAGKRARHGFSDDGSGAGKRAQHGFSDDGPVTSKSNLPENHPSEGHEKKSSYSHCDKFFPTNDTLMHHLYSEIVVTAQLATGSNPEATTQPQQHVNARNSNNQNNEEHMIYEDTNQGPEQCPAEQNVHQNNFIVSETSVHDNISLISKVDLEPIIFEDRTESHNLPNNDEMKVKKAIDSQNPIIIKKRNIFSITTTRRAATALKSPEKVRSLSDKTTQEENEYEIRYKCRLCGEDFKEKTAANVHKTYKHSHISKPRKGYQIIFQYTILKKPATLENIQQNNHDDDVAVPSQDDVTISPQDNIHPQIISETDYRQPEPKVQLALNKSNDAIDRPNGYLDEDSNKTKQNEVKRAEIQNILDSEFIQNKETDAQIKRLKNSDNIECINIPPSHIDECFDSDESYENNSLASSISTQPIKERKRKDEARDLNIDKKRTMVRSNNVSSTEDDNASNNTIKPYSWKETTKINKQKDSDISNKENSKLLNNDDTKAKKVNDAQKPISDLNKQNIVSIITTRVAAAALQAPEKISNVSYKTTKTQEKNDYDMKYKSRLCGEDFKRRHVASRYKHRGIPRLRQGNIFKCTILKNQDIIQENNKQNENDEDVTILQQDNVSISSQDNILPQTLSESGYSQPEPKLQLALNIMSNDAADRANGYLEEDTIKTRQDKVKRADMQNILDSELIQNKETDEQIKRQKNSDNIECISIPSSPIDECFDSDDSYENNSLASSISTQPIKERKRKDEARDLNIDKKRTRVRSNDVSPTHDDDASNNTIKHNSRKEITKINKRKDSDSSNKECSQFLNNDETKATNANDAQKPLSDINKQNIVSIIPTRKAAAALQAPEIVRNVSPQTKVNKTQEKNDYEIKYKCRLCGEDFRRRHVAYRHKHRGIPRLREGYIFKYIILKNQDSQENNKQNELDEDVTIPPQDNVSISSQDDILLQIVSESDYSQPEPKVQWALNMSNDAIDRANGYQEEDTNKTKQDEVKRAEIQNIIDAESTKNKESDEEIKRKNSTDDIECISIPSSPIDECFDTNESYENNYVLASSVVTQTIERGKRKGEARDSNINKNRTKASSYDVSSIDDDDASNNTIKHNARKQNTKKNKQKDIHISNDESSSDTDAGDIIREIEFYLKKRKINSLKRLLQLSKNSKDKMKRNRKENIYKCKKCSIHFIDEKSLRKHLYKQKHNDKKKHCVICNLKFSKKTVKRHVKKHHVKMSLGFKDFDVITELSSSESSDTTSSDDTDNDTRHFSQSQDSEPSTSNENHTEQVENYVKAKKIFTTAENDQDILISRGPKATCLPLLVKTDENTEDNSEPSTSNENHTEQVENYVKAKNLFTTTETGQDILISRGPKATGLPLLVKTDENTEDNSEPSTSNENHTEQVENYVKAKKLFTTAENDQDILISCGPKATCLPLLVQTDDNTENNSEVTKSIELYKCEICDIYFIQYETWRKHLSTGDHTIKTKTQCPKCGLNFTKCSLKKHICLHHKKDKNSIKFKIISGSNKLSYINPQISLEQVDQKKIKHNKTKYDIASGIPKTILQTMNKNEDLKQVPRLALERLKQQEKNTNQPKIKYASRLSKTISKKPNLRSISYGKTIYQCRICKVCFLTLTTILSHLHTKRHDMSAVTSCSICHLSFYDRVMDRHFQFHHKTLKLRDSSDFQVKILPRFKKNTQNLNEKSANNSQEEKIVYSTRRNTHNEFEDNRNHTTQEDKEDEKKKQIHSIFLERQIQEQTELGQKCKQPTVKKQLENNIQKTPADKNHVDERLFKCSQCHVHYFKKRSLLAHMTRGKHDIKELRPCPICHYTFSSICLERHISLQHLKLQIEKFTIVNSVKGDEGTQESSSSNLVNNLKNMRLKECSVVLTDSHSALVSSTSNGASKFEPLPQVDSVPNVLEFSDEHGTLDVDIDQDTLISEKLYNNISVGDIGHDTQLSNIDSQPENINAANMDIEAEVKGLDKTEMESNNAYFRNSVLVPNSVSTVKILSNVLFQKPFKKQAFSNTPLTNASDESVIIENATQIEQESYITSETQNSLQETARGEMTKAFATKKHAKPELTLDNSCSSDSTTLHLTSDREYVINSEESTSSCDSYISDIIVLRPKKKKNSVLNKYTISNTKSFQNTPSCSKNNFLISETMNKSEEQHDYENLDETITSTTDIEDQPKKCKVKEVKQEKNNFKSKVGQTTIDINSLTNPKTKRNPKKKFTKKSVHTLNSNHPSPKKPVSPELFKDIVDDPDKEDKVKVVDINKFCCICMGAPCFE